MITELADFNFSCDSPLVAAAIHNGHQISRSFSEKMLISAEERLFEEDPYTERFTASFCNRLIVYTSRFEVDLNRSADKSVYLTPQEAWGLNIWQQQPSEQMIISSREKYIHFYNELFDQLSRLHDRYGNFFVWDIHSYNSRLPAGSKEDRNLEPDIMIGLNNMPHKWFSLVEKIRDSFSKFDFFGRKLAVTTQGKYTGGNFSRWIHNTFPDSAMCIALEFKKIFMDQWTGKLEPEKQNKLIEMLASASDLIKTELLKL